jgi:hypothetical protein
MTGCCEHGNEHSGPKMRGLFGVTATVPCEGVYINVLHKIHALCSCGLFNGPSNSSDYNALNDLMTERLSLE